MCCVIDRYSNARIIEISVCAGQFEHLLSGSPTCEMILLGQHIEVGNILYLREFDDLTKAYTTRSVYRMVSAVKSVHPRDAGRITVEGFQIISF